MLRRFPRSNRRFFILRVCALGLLIGWPVREALSEIDWSDWKPSGSVKFSGLLSRDSDPSLGQSDKSGAALSRFRLNWDIDLNASDLVFVAYEMRSQYFSSPNRAVGIALFPALGTAPYRLAQLDWSLGSSGRRLEFRHEIDRLGWVSRKDWGQWSIGRQAIGLGRGVLFSALDHFAPFSPTEVDREWRRGVDAVRLEFELGARASAEALGILGESWEDSALLGRLRGFTGPIDGEILFGKRAEDLFFGLASSAAVGDAALYSEFALFDVPNEMDYPGRDWVSKAVIGSSYHFDIGTGLTVFAEYHYSGFGVDDVGDLTALALDENFARRFLRGDFQVLGRHSLGLQASTSINDAIALGALSLVNIQDGSGLFAPNLSWDVSDQTSFRMNLFVPWGADATSLRLQSEYGAAPVSLFFQVATYF